MAPGTPSGIAALRPSRSSLNTRPPQRSSKTNARPVVPAEPSPSSNIATKESYASACIKAQRPAWSRPNETINDTRNPGSSGPSSISSQRSAWSKGSGQTNNAASYLFPGASTRDSRSFRTVSTMNASTRTVVAAIETDPKTARKGSLVEFEKDKGKVAVGVVVGTQGKKNLLVLDQFGTSHSVKPQQITFSVLPQKHATNQSGAASSDMSPGFSPADIIGFLSATAKLMDASLVELAWEESRESGTKEFTLVQLTQLLVGGAGPVECYACHRMIASDGAYFKMIKKSAQIFYEPRQKDQVMALRAREQQEREARERMREFASKCREAVRAKWGEKPTAEFWKSDEYAAPRIEALTAMALERPIFNEALAKEVLVATGTSQDAESALELLTSLGVLPRHINTALIQANLPLSFLPQIAKTAEATAENPPPDPDREIRRDLTHLKVYMIDSADTVEVDDGLSAEVLEDGRVKVWVHVADPTRWMSLGSTLDIAARNRGTSMYLPNAIVPMIPFPLAAGPMSLHYGQQNSRHSDSDSSDTDSLSSTASDSSADSSLTSSSGSPSESSEEDVMSKQCAVSVGVVLRDNGSIEVYDIVNSYITPTYRLTFDDVVEMMSVAGAEEEEMGLLVEASRKRTNWRQEQGSLEMSMPEADIKVKHSEKPEPLISLRVIDQSTVARTLVTEMMVLCGEVVAHFGERNKIPLPYRGQQAAEISAEAEEMLKGLRGLSLSAHLRTCMTKSVTNCSAPIPHAALGLQGYVQFSSPIRRYGDLLAHYQVKSVLRGEPPPLSVSQLEKFMLNVGNCQRSVGKVEGWTRKYWLLEHLRRLPAGTAMTAVMLRWIKEGADALALVHLPEAGFETTMRMSRRVKFGEELAVVIMEVNPRRGVLRLAETDAQVQDELVVYHDEEKENASQGKTQMHGSNSIEAIGNERGKITQEEVQSLQPTQVC